MKIIVSKHHGPCCGVRRALDIAFDIIERKKENVYSFGPLIHNPQVVSKLSEKGIKVIEKLDNIKKGTIIIRTHGIPREIKEEMKKKNLEVIDATCPIVAKVQKIVTELTEKKYKVIIIGKKEHPEVKALVSYANEPIILNSVDEAISLPKMSKCGVVGQTTILFENFKNIVSLLLDKSYELKIYNTLCKETYKMQEDAYKLSKEVELIIVIGGKNSANTKQLVDLCKENVVTYHIENADEINEEWFKNKNVIGITSGASTPEWVLNDVIKKLKTIKIK